MEDDNDVYEEDDREARGIVDSEEEGEDLLEDMEK